VPGDAHAARRHGGERVKIIHDRIEAIAGAIALGEATDDERREYREHVSLCARCLDAYAGEREIERVAATVAAARDAEMWEPNLGDIVRSRRQRRARALQFALGTLAACLAIAVGLRIAFVSGAVHTPRIVVDPVTSVAKSGVLAQPQPRRMIVMHNVVQIARAPLEAPPVIVAPKQHAASAQIAAVTIHPEVPQTATAQTSHKPAAHAETNVPVWRSNVPIWRTVAKTTTTSVTESAPQTFTHSAESLQIVAPPLVHEASPIGGETAINPEPPMAAYDEGAEGTTAFEVLIDEQGNPTRCIVTKPAGYDILDSAVCKAAMKARYTPKTIAGKAVPGVYYDAFTFRMSGDEDTSAPH
jgi:TonB family protein